jgi:hypothetical protein
MKKIAKAAFLAAALCTACSGGFTTVAPKPPAKFRTLGTAHGSACGSMLIYSSPLNFIPAGLNGRVENAYKDALSSVPGATALIDVTIQENWFWWILGTTRCVKISGEAVK